MQNDPKRLTNDPKLFRKCCEIDPKMVQMPAQKVAFIFSAGHLRRKIKATFCLAIWNWSSFATISQHFRIDFKTFLVVFGSFRIVFGLFSDRFAWFLRRFFRFLGVVDVVIIVFVVFAVIVVRVDTPTTPWRRKKSQGAFFRQVVAPPAGMV